MYYSYNLLDMGDNNHLWPLATLDNPATQVHLAGGMQHIVMWQKHCNDSNGEAWTPSPAG